MLTRFDENDNLLKTQYHKRNESKRLASGLFAASAASIGSLAAWPSFLCWFVGFGEAFTEVPFSRKPKIPQQRRCLSKSNP